MTIRAFWNTAPGWFTIKKGRNQVSLSIHQARKLRKELDAYLEAQGKAYNSSNEIDL